jgi:hypothetical protein
MATQWQHNPMRPMKSNDSLAESKPPRSFLPPFDFKPKELRDAYKDLSIEMELTQPIQVTNGTVQGTFKINCYKEQRLGKVQVYLVGFEQEPRKHRGKVFLQKSWVIQESHLVPCEAVIAGSPDEYGMWKSKVQATIFDFSIPFRETNDNIRNDVEVEGSLPSSYYYPKVGGIRYFVIGLVDSMEMNAKRPRKPLAIFKELVVVESVPFALTNQFDTANPFNSALEQVITKQIKTGIFGMGKQTHVELKAKLWTLSIDGQMETGVWQSGSQAYVEVNIDNQSNKTVSFSHLVGKHVNFALESDQNI